MRRPTKSSRNRRPNPSPHYVTFLLKGEPPMAEKNMVEAIHDAMLEEMKRDDRIIVMGEDVGEGGVFRATDGFVAEFGHELCLDTQLADRCIVGAATGSSLSGSNPIAEIPFAECSHPSFD